MRLWQILVWATTTSARAQDLPAQAVLATGKSRGAGARRLLPSLTSDLDPRCFDSLNFITPTGSTVAPTRWADDGTMQIPLNNRITELAHVAPHLWSDCAELRHSSRLPAAPQQRIGEHWSLPDGILKTQHGVLMRLKGDQLSQQCVSFDCYTKPSCLRIFC